MPTYTPSTIPLLSPTTHTGPIHLYTHCAHTCPPTTRPLNIQPVLYTLADKSTKSVLSGLCPECDTAARRRAEAAVLAPYLARILAVEARYGRAGADEGLLDAQVGVLRQLRDGEVGGVWSGYSARWGIGCVGRDGEGRMVLRWERGVVKGEGKGRRV